MTYFYKATLIATVTLSLVVEAQSTPPATGHCLPGWEHFGAYCYYNNVYGVSIIYTLEESKLMILTLLSNCYVKRSFKTFTYLVEFFLDLV